MIAEIKNGEKRIIAENNKTLEHTHKDQNSGGKIDYDDLINKPTFLGGGLNQDSYRLSQLLSGNTNYFNSICHITRIEFLVFLTHIRSPITSIGNNAIIAKVPVGFEPITDIVVNARLQGQNGGATGDIKIDTNGNIISLSNFGSQNSPCFLFSAMWVTNKNISLIPDNNIQAAQFSELLNL